MLDVLKKIFTVKRVTIALTIIVVLAIIAVPKYKRHIINSRNEAAQVVLQKISLSQIHTCRADCRDDTNACCSFAFTDDVNETMEEAILRLVDFGFSPDASVAFHIMRPGIVEGVSPDSFIAFAAHNSVGSPVYVYDYVVGGNIKQALEDDVYSGVSINSVNSALFCYTYDPADTANPVKKKPRPIKFAPAPNEAYPARMLVTVPAE